MMRNWNERDHPRDGEGRFRDKVGGSGWAKRISDAIGRARGLPQVEPGMQRRAGMRGTTADPSGDPSGGYDAEAQERWEAQVRVLFRAAGHDPDQIEADVDGFGQNYMEYADDPGGFVQSILEDMEPDDAGGGLGFDALPDGDEPGVKVIAASTLAAQAGEWGSEFEVFNPESGKWEVLRSDSETVGAGRSGMEDTTGFISTEGDGFHFTAEPDAGDYDDEEEFEQALDDYENDPWGEVQIRRYQMPPSSDVQGRPLPGGFDDNRITPSSVREALTRKVHGDSRLSSRISDDDLAQLSDAILDEVIEQANDDYLNLDDPTLTFKEFVLDQLGEMLRRFGPDELWPHHF